MEGKHGNVDLKGVKFWLSGDLGDDWGTKAEADWLVVTFEPDPSRPTQVGNLKYFAATWSSPFDLYFSDHYYKGFGKDYDLKQANGFTIVVEATSDGNRVSGGAAKKTD